MAATTPKEDLQAWAARFLPSGAGKVEFVKLVTGPFSIGGRAVNEAIFKFDFGGISTSLSISVVDFNDKEQLLLVVSVPGKGFDQIRQQAIGSMFTWTPLE